MRIAHIAPLAESVPPRLYGGTERIVSYITEEQVRQGHEVTLFASADSITSARLVGCAREALRLDPNVRDPWPYHFLMLDHVIQWSDQFDVLHFHIDIIHLPLLRLLSTPAVTTLHGRLDLPDLKPFYRRFCDHPLVSISEAQRRPLPAVNWVRTVYHGLPQDLLPFTPNPEGYLAFLGRISPEKRPDRAIEIAARAGLPLKIAAKIDRLDQDYWRSHIEPLVRRHACVEYIGEINEDEKAAFLGNALAVLFPIDWPEPFGLVMIEAMACGTPTIAFRCGSVPEVIEDGVSGYIVDSIDEAMRSAEAAGVLDRAGVRAAFDRRFTAERMALDYQDVYETIGSGGHAAPRRGRPFLPLSGGGHRERTNAASVERTRGGGCPRAARAIPDCRRPKRDPGGERRVAC
jgi:glycosyltransferase involved in cell wall biosynthesis